MLKEVLDEPGARQRLIAALEPSRQRAWLWVTAAATLAVAVIIGIVVSSRTPPPEPPQQIAQVLKSPEPVAPPVAVAPAPPPPAVQRNVAPAPPPPAAPELQKTETENKLADQIQEAKPQAAGGIRQFAAARVASSFAFNYTVGADGFLVIVPASRGFLSVTASDAVIFPSGAVNAAAPVRIAIPSGATSLVIAFTGTQGVTGAPVRRDGPSGTVTDQDPPNARILIQLFLTPATR